MHEALHFVKAEEKYHIDYALCIDPSQIILGGWFVASDLPLTSGEPYNILLTSEDCVTFHRQDVIDALDDGKSYLGFIAVVDINDEAAINFAQTLKLMHENFEDANIGRIKFSDLLPSKLLSLFFKSRQTFSMDCKILGATINNPLITDDELTSFLEKYCKVFFETMTDDNAFIDLLFKLCSRTPTFIFKTSSILSNFMQIAQQQLDVVTDPQTLLYWANGCRSVCETDFGLLFIKKLGDLSQVPSELLILAASQYSAETYHIFLSNFLKDDQYSADEKADILTLMGNNFLVGNPILAQLFLRASASINQNAAASLNLGNLASSQGNLDIARQAYANIGRFYCYQSGDNYWPALNSKEWPNYTIPRRIYDAKSWPKISVVIPSYNQGHYIESTLKSILNQNYPNLELIVLDNVSTDETKNILNQYKDQINILKIEKDKGQSDAIKRGFQLSTGDLLCWLNSDDLFAPYALYHVASSHLLKAYDIYSGQCIEFQNNQMMLINTPFADGGAWSESCLADLGNYWLKGAFFYQPEVFFTRDIYERAGGFIDTQLYYTMDYDLWCRMLKADATLKVNSWPYAYFRRHAEQKTSPAEQEKVILEQERIRDKYFN